MTRFGVDAATPVHFGWIGHMDPPADFVARLREIDPDADVRWVPGPLSRPPRWELGVWWQPNEAHRQGARMALDNIMGMQAVHRQKRAGRIRFLRDVIKGWRPVFQVPRQLEGRDIEEFRERDWQFRNAFDRIVRAAMAAFDNEEQLYEEEMQGIIHDALNDKTMMRLIQGGFSVTTNGWRDRSTVHA